MKMKHKPENHYSMAFIEEDGKIFVLFYDSNDELVARREIPHQDTNEGIRASGNNN